MEIQDYKNGDEGQIIELFEMVFGQKMSEKQWRWRFIDNPAGSKKIKLMWEGEKLIGHYAVSPIILNVNGKSELTAHSLTTMTHPEFGGRGIFGKLSTALYDYLEQELDYKAIWGYPNSNSHYGFIKNLGWKNIGAIHTLSKSIDSLKLIESSDLKLYEIEKFTSKHSDFINSYLKDYPVYVQRSEAYLNWRFVQKPSTDYKIFEIVKNDICGLLVTKLYPLKNGGFDLNIVECFLEDYLELDIAIEGVRKSYSVKNVKRVSVWKNLHDKSYIKLEKLGYKADLPITYLGARMNPMIQSEMGDFRNWYISMGDSDVF